MDMHLRVERFEGTLKIVLSRPEKLNALSMAMLDRLEGLFDDASADLSLRAVLLCGSGRAFCAGADVAGYAAQGFEEFVRFQRKGMAVLEAIGRCLVPVVAVVEGLALGGGFELALACDAVMAGLESRFALPEVRLGLIPGGGGTQRLTQIVGPMVARELLLTGRQITGEEAYRLGLVTRLGPQPLEDAVEFVRQVSLAPRQGVALIKQAVAWGQGVSPTALGLEHQTLLTLYQTGEGQEGVRAFVEKRSPKFSGSGGPDAASADG